MPRISLHAIVAILLLSVVTVRAEVPEQLRGDWVIAAEATEAYMRKSPKWDEEMTKYLPMVLKRMARITHTFTADTLTATMGERSNSLPLTLTESKDKSHAFASKAGEKDVTITVIVHDDNTINIRSSMTDDMDYYLWKPKPEDWDSQKAAAETDNAAKPAERPAERDYKPAKPAERPAERD